MDSKQMALKTIFKSSINFISGDVFSKEIKDSILNDLSGISFRSDPNVMLLTNNGESKFYLLSVVYGFDRPMNAPFLQLYLHGLNATEGALIFNSLIELEELSRDQFITLICQPLIKDNHLIHKMTADSLDSSFTRSSAISVPSEFEDRQVPINGAFVLEYLTLIFNNPTLKPFIYKRKIEIYNKLARKLLI